MSKHTHKGNCQICGRLQAVTSSRGKIANHGYIVDGMHKGTCTGSGREPLQREKKYTVEEIKYHRWNTMFKLPTLIKALYSDDYSPTLYRVTKKQNPSDVKVVINTEKYMEFFPWYYDICSITVNDAVKILKASKEDILNKVRAKKEAEYKAEIISRKRKIESFKEMINGIHGTRLIPNN